MYKGLLRCKMVLHVLHVGVVVSSNVGTVVRNVPKLVHVDWELGISGS